jgi:hypothetical protein
MLHAIGFMGRERRRVQGFTTTTSVENSALGTRAVWPRVHIAIATPYAHATHSGSCKTAAATRTRQNLFRGALARSRQGGSAGGASFGRADAAKVGNNVGSVVVDGIFECSCTAQKSAARQIVSERW